MNARDLATINSSKAMTRNNINQLKQQIYVLESKRGAYLHGSQVHIKLTRVIKSYYEAIKQLELPEKELE